MPRPIPIYHSHDATYRADSCLPLVEAVAKKEVRLHALVRGHYPGKKISSGALPGVKSVGHWDAGGDQAWGLGWHRNEGIELTFLETGSIGFAVDDRTFDLHPGDLTFTRPWQLHRVGSPLVACGRLHWLILDVGVRRPNQPWKWPAWILLSKHDRDELTNILRHNEQPVWTGSGELRQCFVEIGQAVKADRGGDNISRLNIRLNELFLLVLEMLRKRKVRLDHSLSSSRRTVELFLADLQARPEHLNLEWSVQEMARLCGLGVTQFVSHARALTNMTPVHYLNHCRLELAAKLLRESPQMSVTDIALGCGFSTSQYFATAFAQRFGRSPRDFRATTKQPAR